ncbi:hypothetical protein [Alteromonas sp. 14N.309.X.WAT.G.H12]|uniref:hypothetical protein n=1 Tax=Alteromonas sp. 14N.309.X.WAT.G.H12 TaxID=3120824 RepID=UPI002FD5A079
MKTYDSLETVSNILGKTYPSANTIRQAGEDIVSQWLNAIDGIEARIVLADIILGGEWKHIRMPKPSVTDAEEMELGEVKQCSAWLDEFILSIVSKTPESVPNFNYRYLMPHLTRFKAELLDNPSLSLFYRKVSVGLRDNAQVGLPRFVSVPDDSALRLEWYKLYTAHGELTSSLAFQDDITRALNFDVEWASTDPNLLIYLASYTIKSKKTSSEGFRAIDARLLKLAKDKPELTNISKVISALT